MAAILNKLKLYITLLFLLHCCNDLGISFVSAEETEEPLGPVLPDDRGDNIENSSKFVDFEENEKLVLPGERGADIENSPKFFESEENEEPLELALADDRGADIENSPKFVESEENEEPLELALADDRGADIENSPNFVESEHSVSQAKRQFKTAEIADAVMGTQPQIDPTNIKSIFYMNMKDYEVHVPSPCDETSDQCDSSDQKPESSQEMTSAIGQNATKSHKVTCVSRNTTGISNFSVQVLNASQDLMEFLNGSATECSVVMFFTSWCQFSAKIAPQFNALPRVFPAIHFFALDAFQHSSISTRFGTVAVPNILLFQGAKPMARFNHTQRSLRSLTAFIYNQTGFEGDLTIDVTDEDLNGPLPSIPVQTIDWVLIVSLFFVTVFTMYAVLRSDSIRWLIPGLEHDHQD